MTKNILNRTIKLILLLSIFAFDTPAAWYEAGSTPKSYDMGIDVGAGQNGTNAATIKSLPRKRHGFGTLMQNCFPDKYRGKRVRMSGYLKTKEVKDWAGLWFRIDEEGSDNPLGFDNLKNGKKDRSVTGTTDWTKYDIVLDVPDKASNLTYGALLSGSGQIWFDELTFEMVDNTVPTTGEDEEELFEPRNLGFEK